MASEGFMTKDQTKPGLAFRAASFGALALGATAIGTLAIGWITIRKLRVFETRLVSATPANPV
jgi:hypothetical protein